jgi:hypothetical protein
MAITFVGAGALTSGTPSQNIPVPAHNANDLIVVLGGCKPSAHPDTSTLAGPAGSTEQGEKLGGGYAVAPAADTGNMKAGIWTQVDTAGTIANMLMTGTNVNNWSFVCLVYRSATGAYDLAYTDGEDTVGNASFTATMAANPGITNGDKIAVCGLIPTDITTPAQFSAETLTATSATIGLDAEVGEFDSGTGNDMGGVVCRFSCTAGTATAAPVFTATATGTLTNVRGPIVLLRIREGSAGTPIDVNITHASTTDAAQALSVVLGTAHSKTLVNAATTDTAQALAFTKAAIQKTLTPVTTADASQVLAFTKAAIQKTLTAALMADSAQALSYNLGSPVLATLTAATTTDTAVALSFIVEGGGDILVSILPASEADQAQTLTFTQAALEKALAPVSETDAAQPLAITNQAILKALVAATESDAARPMSFTQAAIQRSIAAASTTDVARALTANLGTPITVAILPAGEADSAQGLAFVQSAIFKSLTPATELSDAVALVFEGGAEPPAPIRRAKWYISRPGWY